MEVGGQCHAQAILPGGKTWYPVYRRLGEPQSQYGQVRKILSPLGFDRWTIQPVASRYTDYTTSPPITTQYDNKCKIKIFILYLVL
jgi:hypothetical protein